MFFRDFVFFEFGSVFFLMFNFVIVCVEEFCCGEVCLCLQHVGDFWMWIDLFGELFDVVLFKLIGVFWMFYDIFLIVGCCFV